MPDDSVTQVISSISNMFIESSELSPFFASYTFKTEQHKANVQTEYKVVYFLFYFLKPWKATCAKGTHTEHLFEITPPPLKAVYNEQHMSSKVQIALYIHKNNNKPEQCNLDEEYTPPPPSPHIDEEYNPLHPILHNGSIKCEQLG